MVQNVLVRKAYEYKPRWLGLWTPKSHSSGTNSPTNNQQANADLVAQMPPGPRHAIDVSHNDKRVLSTLLSIYLKQPGWVNSSIVILLSHSWGWVRIIKFIDFGFWLTSHSRGVVLSYNPRHSLQGEKMPGTALRPRSAYRHSKKFVKKPPILLKHDLLGIPTPI